MARNIGKACARVRPCAPMRPTTDDDHGFHQAAAAITNGKRLIAHPLKVAARVEALLRLVHCLPIAALDAPPLKRGI